MRDLPLRFFVAAKYAFCSCEYRCAAADTQFVATIFYLCSWKEQEAVLLWQNQLCSYKTASCFCPYIYLRLEKKSSRREILTAQHSTPNKSSCKFDTGFAAAKTKRSFVAATLIVPLRVCLPFMRLLKMHNALQQTQICICKRDLCSEKCS